MDKAKAHSTPTRRAVLRGAAVASLATTAVAGVTIAEAATDPLPGMVARFEPLQIAFIKAEAIRQQAGYELQRQGFSVFACVFDHNVMLDTHEAIDAHFAPKLTTSTKNAAEWAAAAFHKRNRDKLHAELQALLDAHEAVGMAEKDEAADAAGDAAANLLEEILATPIKSHAGMVAKLRAVAVAALDYHDANSTPENYPVAPQLARQVLAFIDGGAA